MTILSMTNNDHKVLETIFGKKLSSCLTRLQRLVLKSLKYDVNVKYTKGTKVLVADVLSRILPQPAPVNDQLPQPDIHCVTKKDSVHHQKDYSRSKRKLLTTPP